MYSHFLFPIWHSVFLPVTLPQWDRGDGERSGHRAIFRVAGLLKSACSSWLFLQFVDFVHPCPQAGPVRAPTEKTVAGIRTAVTLHVPQLKGVSFETAIIERYRRRESSVKEALIEMYLAGVSVHRVEDITEAL